MGIQGNPICIRCNEKPKRTRGKNSPYLLPYCNACHSEITKAWYKSNPEKYARHLQNVKRREAKKKRTIKRKQVREEKLFLIETATKTPKDYNQCIEWKYKRNDADYGYCFFDKARSNLAHRLVLEIKSDEILPKGIDASHICHNRPCINPNHLIAEPHRDNVQRSKIDARKWHRHQNGETD